MLESWRLFSVAITNKQITKLFPTTAMSPTAISTAQAPATILEEISQPPAGVVLPPRDIKGMLVAIIPYLIANCVLQPLLKRQLDMWRVMDRSSSVSFPYLLTYVGYS